MCGLCKSKCNLIKSLEIVNKPVECVNPDCGVLYCTYCLTKAITKSCVVCKKPNSGYRNPSAIITRTLN